jgi:hypothetical protein
VRTYRIEIDEGSGDKFHHAQGNYLPKPLMTIQGIYQYKLVDGKVVDRTAEEIAADVTKIPPPPPSAEERIKALETELAALKPTLTKLAEDMTMLKAGPGLIYTKDSN